MRRYSELFYWKVMQEKHLQRPCNSAETQWNSCNKDIFWWIPPILWESNYFNMLIFTNPYFILFLEPHVVYSDIYWFHKLIIKVAFLFYLGFAWVYWTAPASILIFFVPYLLNFCYCRSVIFATAISFASLCFLCASIDNFKYVLYAVPLLPSLTGLNKCIWSGLFK